MAAVATVRRAEKAQRLRKNALHRAQCVLRDAPRLHRIAPQHDGMLLMTLRKCLILRCLAKRSEEHTSELQSRFELVCRLLLEKKKRGRSKPISGTRRARRIRVDC